MAKAGFFFNGVYRSVLDGILSAQEKRTDDIFYLQPYIRMAIARLSQGGQTTLSGQRTSSK